MAGESIGSRIGGWVQDGLAAVGIGREEVRKAEPKLEDEVTVEVTGQPGATKQQLYFLALAAANGVVRQQAKLGVGNNLLSTAYGMLMIEYDAADNWVRCTIKYTYGMGAALAANKDRTGHFSAFFDSLALYRGPQCNVNGGVFGFVGDSSVPGVPDTPNNLSAPRLPFAGQRILTSCPRTPVPRPSLIIKDKPAPDYPLGTATGGFVGTLGAIINGALGAAGGLVEIDSPNPKPPGDNRSRGAVVVSAAGVDRSPSTALPSPGQSQTAGQQSPGDTPRGPNYSDAPASGGRRCCVSVLGLIPLVYAALSSAATDSRMTFSPPAGTIGG